jgi:hypothetical protein
MAMCYANYNHFIPHTICGMEVMGGVVVQFLILTNEVYQQLLKCARWIAMENMNYKKSLNN